MEVGLGIKVPKDLTFYFDQYRENISKHNFSDEQIAFRSHCWQDFKSKGFPTVKNENWKYTNVAAILDLPLVKMKSLEQKEISKCKEYVEQYFASHNTVCLLDGEVVLHAVSGDLKVTSLEKLYSGESTKQLSNYLNLKTQHREFSLSSFDCLNSALSVSGVLIEVPKNKIIEKPLSIIHFSSGKQVVNTQPCVNVSLSEGSQLTLNEVFVGSEGRYFSNVVTEVSLDKGSVLNYLKIQNESNESYHIGHNSFKLAYRSVLNAFTLSLGAKLCRNNLFAYVGEEAEANVNGLYLARSGQHIDNGTVILHDKEKGVSRQLYKGLLKENSRAVFNGKIKISKGAQKVDSAQMNKNVILGKKAEVDSKPELEVYADDVKANHGSATGEMDHSEVFYLMSRGISKLNAISMLSRGYAEDVVFKIGNQAQRELVRQFLDKTLDDNFFGSEK